MEAQTMIDNLITDALHLSTTDAYVTAEWRPKILRILQRVVNKLYTYDIPWKQAGPVTLTLTANNRSVEAPSGFGLVGAKGGLYAANDREIIWRDPDYVAGWYTDDNTGVPDHYTIYGVGASDRPAFHFDRKPTSDYPMSLFYEKEPPTITDASSSSGLARIPVSFHEDVIFPAAWEWLALGGGDGRAGLEFSKETETALGRAIARYQHGKEGLQQFGDRGIPDLQMW